MSEICNKLIFTIALGFIAGFCFIWFLFLLLHTKKECTCNKLRLRRSRNFQNATSSSLTISSTESYAFFDEDENIWQRKKSIHQRQVLRQTIDFNSDLGRKYFQYHWEPTWKCNFEERVGNIGDGGKWICDPFRLQHTNSCQVISVGSNNEYSFENAIHELNPNCRIATFDHTVVNPSPPPFVEFYPFGIGTDNSGNIINLKTALEIAGMIDGSIDILKIDCEGCEYSVYSEFYSPGVFLRQILIEIHYQGKTLTDSMMHKLTNDGHYVIFHKEPNTNGCAGDCVEYGFLKLNI